MNIEILCTGDEILTGKTINSNHAFIAQRLVESGFTMVRGTIVGDDRDSLRTAFAEASARANVVIVNGGLGPTVDDLSQEVAADAAGVELVLHEDWLARMDAWYTGRGRVMPKNNHKQAMLPAGAEFIDNPIGTACGFAIDIDGARFFFTPGVPREMRRMITEQVLPRLEEMRGYRQVTRVKRFHSFGIGESRADLMLEGIEEMVADNAVKLGFQSHYPQLETKLTAQGPDKAALDALIAPLADAVRDRFGNFILCEDDQTLEGAIAELLTEINGSVAVIEMQTGGSITTRLLRGGAALGRGTVCGRPEELANLFEEIPSVPTLDVEYAARIAGVLRKRSEATHALVVLTSPVETAEDSEPATDVMIAVCGPDRSAERPARLPGSAEWMRSGATELGLDCLRRFLAGIEVNERIDFEQH